MGQDIQAVIVAANAAISPARLAPYLQLAHGGQSAALDLYRHNLRLSGAAYEALAVVEVALRNAIDQQLRIWNHTQRDRVSGQLLTSNWLLTPAPLLRRLIGNDIRTAGNHVTASRRARVAGHDDLLAQLSFGTWRYLLPDGDRGKRYLWAVTLQYAFPHLKNGRARLVEAVDGVYRLRNRVAHLEPLLKESALRRQVRNMRFVMRCLNPDLEIWFRDISRVDEVLAEAPLVTM